MIDHIFVCNFINQEKIEKVLQEKIKAKSKEICANVIQNRRHLHQHPELSFQEFQTSAYIKARLDDMGISWQPMANTGIVAILSGEKPSDRIIALRADIDALPIVETNDLPYKSESEGVMHACGHDAHTASLLGVIEVLQSIKADFGGTIKFIFQPGEEKLPGGASIMIHEGVLDNPKPDFVIGQHVMPSLPCGKIATRKGKFMASMDEILMTVKGKGGHGAQPHMLIDPVLIASHIIVSLQQVVSRMVDPTEPSVLSFGKVIANGAINVIPDEVYMEGTFRAMNESWRTFALDKIEFMAKSIAESMGGSCEVKITRGYPCLFNSEDLTGRVIEIAQSYLGIDRVVEQDMWMAAEDFAYYSQNSDACFYLLGVGNVEKGIQSGLHTPDFKIDEDALIHSTGLMAYVAVKILAN